MDLQVRATDYYRETSRAVKMLAVKMRAVKMRVMRLPSIYPWPCLDALAEIQPPYPHV